MTRPTGPRLRAGLIGQPVAHSLSPPLHRAAGESCGVEVDYRLYATAPDAVDSTLDMLRCAGLDGVNVTAPHKEAAAAWVDALTPVARALGAVNTIIFGGPDGRALGDNTDVEGFARAIDPLPGRRALVLGAGGAARAVVWALLDAGAEVTVANRSVERAAALCNRLAADGGARAQPASLSEAPDVMVGVDLLVDALPTPAVAAALPFDAMAGGARVMTLRYGPSVDPLRAAVGGRRPLRDGLAMLAWQGIAAFERWTGRAPVPAAVFEALRLAAGGRR